MPVSPLVLVLHTALTLGPAQVPAAAAKDYSELLAKHVKNGRVDYKSIAAKDMKKLDDFLAAVGDAKVPGDRNAALGFYADAYNATVIKAVIDNKMPRSVLDVRGFFDAQPHKVAGQSITLDALEKKVINPFAKDSRTHMVLVCGAVGCPILEGKAFAGSNMDARMDAATKRYLASPTGAVVSSGELKLSKIFDWYSADFAKENKGDIPGLDGKGENAAWFLSKFVGEPTKAKLLAGNMTVAWQDYDWTLNKQ